MWISIYYLFDAYIYISDPHGSIVFGFAVRGWFEESPLFSFLILFGSWYGCVSCSSVITFKLLSAMKEKGFKVEENKHQYKNTVKAYMYNTENY